MSIPDWMIDTPSASVDDLSSLVARLAHSLRKASPDNDLPDKAMDYLARHGVASSPFRELQPSQAQPVFGDEEHVSVPRGLLGAACSAIDKKRDGVKVLAELRRYTFGDLSAPRAQAEVQAEPVAVTTHAELQKLRVQGVGSPVGTMFHPDAAGFPVKLYTAPQAQPADALDARRGGKWLTVVYRDVQPGDEAREIGSHQKVAALSWSHALDDRDAAMAAAQEGSKA